MTRLYILVEGQTEEAFIKRVLGPHLSNRGVWARPIIVSTSRQSGGQKHEGGGHWKQWCQDLLRVLREQAISGAWISTMFDLYGLPGDFPELDRVRAGRSAQEKVQLAEQAIQAAVAGMAGADRLIAYVQRHEYEALVLARLEDLKLLLDDPTDLAGLEALADEMGTMGPEDVNDGNHTAPSKRLLRHIPGYDKVLHGELALSNAPITELVARCPHFGAWVERLEGLGATGS